MVEEGFVKLINAGLSSSVPGITGGFNSVLPETFVSKSNPWSWSYRSILSKPLYSLTGENSLTEWTVQVDCVGYDMAHAVQVANAIKGVLSGIWAGVMTDADATQVLGIFQEATQVDGYNPASRNYVRSLEYSVHYYQQ